MEDSYEETLRRYVETRDPRLEGRILQQWDRLLWRHLHRMRVAYDPDARQEALEEAIKGLRKWDPTRGSSLFLYLETAIKRGIRRHIWRSHRIVREPCNGDYIWDGTRPSDWSFDAVVFGQVTRYDLIGASADPLAGEDERRLSMELLGALSDRDRYVIIRRCRGDQQTAIANRLGVSRERVRQLEARALEQMRRYAESIGLETCKTDKPFDSSKRRNNA